MLRIDEVLGNRGKEIQQSKALCSIYCFYKLFLYLLSGFIYVTFVSRNYLYTIITTRCFKLAFNQPSFPRFNGFVAGFPCKNLFFRGIFTTHSCSSRLSYCCHRENLTFTIFSGVRANAPAQPFIHVLFIFETQNTASGFYTRVIRPKKAKTIIQRAFFLSFIFFFSLVNEVTSAFTFFYRYLCEKNSIEYRLPI